MEGGYTARVEGAMGLWVLLLAACSGGEHEAGAFLLSLHDDGAIDLTHAEHGAVLEDLRFLVGTGDAEVEMQFGAFRFSEVTEQLVTSGRFGRVRARVTPLFLEVEDADGEPMGDLVVTPGGSDVLFFDFTPVAGNRVGLQAACDSDDHFLGLGAHALDVDHVGEAFALWVSEPGIGKEPGEEPADAWYLSGTRHASSFPHPYLLRPQRAQGLLVEATGRVDVDLCATDAAHFRTTAWQSGHLRFTVLSTATALGNVETLRRYLGPWPLPPAWVFAPWNDAIRGSERVREVATALREAGAPSSVIWSEDWKGAEQTVFGYHLTGEWTLDEALYPDAEALEAELEAEGFKWLAYFSPFVEQQSEAYVEAEAAGALIESPEGGPYLFTNPRFVAASMVDLSSRAGQDWAATKMLAALALGFDGWMADFAEWLPTDAVLASGQDALEVHNLYPEWWQSLNAAAQEGEDATFFVRSGWVRSPALAPVVWGGDQRTSFDADDGLPTVVPMGLGLAVAGVPVFTHDVAGYSSTGNPPSTRELWFRWAWLGAFSPILRTHHGAYDTDNWQFDSDAETLAHWVTVAREHTRLFPYRYGLAAQAADVGTPMITPLVLRFPEEDPSRTDAWMLGEALLVAPVVEQGATGRQVDLPGAAQWYDWFSHAPVESGYFAAPVDQMPVFARAGTTVPVLSEVPDTLVEQPSGQALGLADVDGARTLYLFGGGGPFVEADGTRYSPSGSATGAGEATGTFATGSLHAAGVTVAIDGTTERVYRVVVIP